MVREYSSECAVHVVYCVMECIEWYGTVWYGNYLCMGFQEDVSQCGTAALPNGKVLASFTACVTIIAVWLLSGDHR